MQLHFFRNVIFRLFIVEGSKNTFCLNYIDDLSLFAALKNYQFSLVGPMSKSVKTKFFTVDILLWPSQLIHNSMTLTL